MACWYVSFHFTSIAHLPTLSAPPPWSLHYVMESIRSCVSKLIIPHPQTVTFRRTQRCWAVYRSASMAREWYLSYNQIGFHTDSTSGIKLCSVQTMLEIACLFMCNAIINPISPFCTIHFSLAIYPLHLSLYSFIMLPSCFPSPYIFSSVPRLHHNAPSDSRIHAHVPRRCKTIHSGNDRVKICKYLQMPVGQWEYYFKKNFVPPLASMTVHLNRYRRTTTTSLCCRKHEDNASRGRPEATRSFCMETTRIEVRDDSEAADAKEDIDK